MIKQKIPYQNIERACIFSLLLVSLMSYSQSVQAQLSLSRNTVSRNTIENSQKQAKKPKLPKNGAPTGRRRAGAGRNPDCPSSLKGLTALVPGDGEELFLVSTVAAYPTYWFYVPELPETAREAELVLQERDGRKVKNVYRKPLKLSGKAGIISITPPDKSEYCLKENKTYQWYFHVYCGDTKATSDNFYVDGFVQKKAQTQTVDSDWYDTLTNLGKQRRAKSQDESINKSWVDLLKGVGLSELADKPILEHYDLEK